MRQYQEQYRAPLVKVMFDGLDTKHSELFTPGNYSPDLCNVDMPRYGAIRKRDGMSLIMRDVDRENYLPGYGDVHQMIALTTADKNSLYAVRGDTVYVVVGAGFTTAWASVHSFSTGGSGTGAVAPYTTETNPTDSETWTYEGPCAYIPTGEDRPIIAQGGTTYVQWPELVQSDVSPVRGYPPRWSDADGLGNPDWPKYFYYGGDTLGGGPDNAEAARMYAWGLDGEPDRIDYSCLGIPYHFGYDDIGDDTAIDHEKNPLIDGGFFFCMRGDGDRVVGVRQLADLLVVFKRKRTVIYHGGVGEGLEQVSILPVGAVSNDSIVIAENDIYFWSDGGPRVLSGVIKYGAVNQKSVAHQILSEVYSVSNDSLPLVHGRYEASWNRIVWHAGSSDSSTPDQCFVFYLPDPDVDAGRWSRWSGYYAEVSATAVTRADDYSRDRVFALDEEGRFYELNLSTVDGEVQSDDYVFETNGLHNSGTTLDVTTTGLPSDIPSTGYIAVEDSNGEMIEVAYSAVTEIDSTTARFTVPTITDTFPDGGTVWSLVEEAYTNQRVISAYYVTSWTDLGVISIDKRLLELMVAYGDNGRGDCEVSYAMDYEPSFTHASETLRTLSGASGLAGLWDYADWNTDSGDADDESALYWDTTGQSIVRFALSGLCFVVRFKVSDESALGFSIDGMAIDVSPKGKV
jgi:hypothetical protein